jgi:molybdopterin converting factor small subunit
LRMAVNDNFVGLDHPLQDGDTLAFIPPVSGG